MNLHYNSSSGIEYPEVPNITFGGSEEQNLKTSGENRFGQTEERFPLTRKGAKFGPEEGLVGYWPLDAINGSTVPDHSSFKNNGVAKWNSQVTTSEREGKAVAFDEKDDCIEIPHTQRCLLNEGIASVWFKTNYLVSGQGIVSKDSESYDTGGRFPITVEKQKRFVPLQSTEEHLSFQIRISPVRSETMVSRSSYLGKQGNEGVY